MTNDGIWQSMLRFFAELGDLLARYATQPGYAVAMVIVGWIIWPIGALIASLLIASLYKRTAEPAGSAPLSGSTTGAPLGLPGERPWLILAGVLLMIMGIFWLVRELIPHISFAFVIIALGLLLIVFGLARREGGSHG
ncbi:MAG: hypothetical protein A2Z21_04300 [Candidatus Fraserbacteria bacterium RBG_16_55_9]|uniref:Uncharacterized protein n=1 Tax=Fraserbacteria sp. (strain RBG_16_55_9) TaxID=1817864 RepID=A0A1F5UP04_FRAXR|nr:MAG: hypothetical protein A2Z21_04300 [Candidatus Fraserbacteria bacterium RBG_16_55_9]